MHIIFYLIFVILFTACIIFMTHTLLQMRSESKKYQQTIQDRILQNNAKIDIIASEIATNNASIAANNSRMAIIESEIALTENRNKMNDIIK